MQIPQVAIRPKKDARIVRAFGDEMILHLSSEDTANQFCLWTNVTPPGGGPPPHYHDNEDEMFWPLSDSAEFLIDETWTRVESETAVFAPRGTVHAFRNPNSKPLEMLIQTIPGGFDLFFQECAEEFARNEPPRMERIVEISASYGIHYPTL